MAETENKEREEIFSRAVRAGKRTYFFDVKSTKGNDYYLTITESKKRFNDDGTHFYEKHKLFLYKEDFDKFFEGLTETVDYIKNNNGNKSAETVSSSENNFSNVSFDDLGKNGNSEGSAV